MTLAHFLLWSHSLSLYLLLEHSTCASCSSIREVPVSRLNTTEHHVADARSSCGDMSTCCYYEHFTQKCSYHSLPSLIYKLSWNWVLVALYIETIDSWKTAAWTRCGFSCSFLLTESISGMKKKEEVCIQSAEAWRSPILSWKRCQGSSCTSAVLLEDYAPENYSPRFL